MRGKPFQLIPVKVGLFKDNVNIDEVVENFNMFSGGTNDY